MKTTIDIAEPIFELAKQRAVYEKTTLKALVEEGLRLALARRKQAGVFKVKPLKTQGGGFQPEFDAAGWEKIRDAIYEPSGR